MRYWPCAFSALLLAGFHTGPALAQCLAPPAHVGTLGLGASATTSLGDWINPRGEIDSAP